MKTTCLASLVLRNSTNLGKSWKNKTGSRQRNATEVRVDLDQDRRLDYHTAGERDRYRIAATNPRKYDLVKEIVEHHKDDQISS